MSFTARVKNKLMIQVTRIQKEAKNNKQKSVKVDLYKKTYHRKFSRHQFTFFAIFVNLQKFRDVINRMVKS